MNRFQVRSRGQAGRAGPAYERPKTTHCGRWIARLLRVQLEKVRLFAAVEDLAYYQSRLRVFARLAIHWKCRFQVNRPPSVSLVGLALWPPRQPSFALPPTVSAVPDPLSRSP